MKYWFTFFLFASVVTISYADSKSLLTDKKIESLLLGKWYLSPEDTEFKNGIEISNFTKDHNVTFTEFSDTHCTEIKSQMKATWTIENVVLFVKVLNRIPKVHFDVGETIEVYFEYINKTKKLVHSVEEFKGDNGWSMFTTKTNTCTKT